MAQPFFERDYSPTLPKVQEAVRRIVEHAHPLQIIAFGSRARGDHRTDSDLDVAVILDAPDGNLHALLPATVLVDLHMRISLLLASKEKYDKFRPWLNSVFYDIEREGIILYDREHPESAGTATLHLGPGRPRSPELRTA